MKRPVVKRTLFGFALLALLACVFFLVGRSIFVRGKLRQANSLEAPDPRKSPRQLLEREDGRIFVIVGDSRVRHWEPFLPEEIPNALGRPGETSSQLLRRLKKDVMPLHPDVLIVQVGINDLVAASISNSPQKWIKRLSDSVSSISKLASEHDTQLVWLTILPPSDLGHLRSAIIGKQIFRHVNRCNALIRQQEKEPGVTVVDISAKIAPDGVLSSFHSTDPMHISEAGYRAINTVLVDRLDAL